MTRRYQPGAAGGGTQRLTPSPTPQGPRAGVQVVRARAPRVGPSAAEEVDGTIAPIDLRAEAGVAEPTHDSTLSNGSRQHVVIQGSCCFCGHTEEDDVLVLAPGPYPPGGERRVCGECIEHLLGSAKAELPRRRLKIAMSMLATGNVSPEMLATIEGIATAAQHTDSPATEDKA